MHEWEFSFVTVNFVKKFGLFQNDVFWSWGFKLLTIEIRCQTRSTKQVPSFLRGMISWSVSSWCSPPRRFCRFVAWEQYLEAIKRWCLMEHAIRTVGWEPLCTRSTRALKSGTCILARTSLISKPQLLKMPVRKSPNFDKFCSKIAKMAILSLCAQNKFFAKRSSVHAL